MHYPGPDFTPWPPDVARRYRRAGYWRGEPLHQWLRDLAARHGDRVAVVGGEARWTYRELARRADRLAAGLRERGVRRGDRFIVQLPNVPEFFAVVFALFRLGALPVFALPAHRRSEISYFAELTGAVGYAVADRYAGFDYRGLAREVHAAAPGLAHVLVAGDPGEFTALSDVDAEPADLPAGPEASDVAFLNISGGSTGLPKLIPRTHDDYLYSVRASAGICGLDESGVYLCVLPVAHNFSLSSPGVLGALHAGGRVVLAARPAPEEAFPLIAREGVTITALVPPLAKVWLDAVPHRRPDLSSLRVVQVGGARLSDEVAARVRPTFGCALQQVFGMAEGLVNYTRLDDPDELVVTTQGRPISPDDEIRIVDQHDDEVPAGQTGQLLTRGPYTVRGYYRAAEHNAVAFTPDGFYRTGDLVRRTPTGHLVVEGRAKDQINRGGEKIAAEEVENHLLAHPAVLDVAVVAVPDPVLGERTCAVVVPRGEPPAPAALRAFLRGRGLADFKIPDRVQLVPAFPLTGVGKVSKSVLRSRLAAALAAGGPAVPPPATPPDRSVTEPTGGGPTTTTGGSGC
ncbi:(2,3-dihydroxybenzoyl)adenylate synthase [Phytohabitans kaempferiae]|uniref:(2,3-dihydroxybenzoyl)adenylate synthase n=1 Tax=Phytohabitans kaempferiae TaxID=1620943 RepID=A0ABV6MA75_9ACTN